MVTRKTATADDVAAVQSVLLELANILERFWDAIVVVGGMVPLLGIPQDVAPHPGTVDIDLALDRRKIPRAGYLSIQEILSSISRPRKPSKGARPGGGLDEAEIHLARIPQSIAMKGFALSRSEAKDPFDIYYMTKYYPGGINALITAFQPILVDPMVKEGLTRIREKFRSVEHIGPKQVADEIDDVESNESIRRDAFEQVSTLLDGLGIP